MDIETRLIAIIVETFAMDADAVNENTGMDNVPEWDSLNQLKLVLSLEEEFGIFIKPDDIVLLQDFKSIIAIIGKYKV